MKKIPFWFPKKNNAIVYIVFIVLFLLSLDFWGWRRYEPLILGMPLWVYYILILTLIISVAFYLFSKAYWSDDE